MINELDQPEYLQTLIQWQPTIDRVERDLTETGIFPHIERNALVCQARVMAAFRECRVSESHFCLTNGYGYDDRGRDVLDELFAKALEAEDALVRPSIISGTQALTIGLFGILRTGDTMLSVTGKPYDTLDEVIGLRGEGMGSLKDYGVNYKEIAIKEDGTPDLAAIGDAIKEDKTVKMVFVQRSKGYSVRPTFSSETIGTIAETVHRYRPDVFVVVDNCYGEFCDEHEPTYYGADLIIGSLIKNAGGGMASCGGYLAGTKKAVELCSYRLTTPGIGREAGPNLGQLRDLYKGLFYAPHTVAQALKTAVFAAGLFREIGCTVYPQPGELRHDIIQTVTLGSREGMLRFCAGIQHGSPVDSHVTPEAWDMPGYGDPVVMAAGAFTAGSSIELSADGPVKAPYVVYLQGGLTYESAKLGILLAAEEYLAGKE